MVILDSDLRRVVWVSIAISFEEVRTYREI